MSCREMTLEEAQEYRQKLVLWRSVPSRAGQALNAYHHEVEVLNAEMAADRELAAREVSAWRSAFQGADKLLATFHDAIPKIIGCVDGKGAACRESRSAFKCCELRIRLAEHNLLPASGAEAAATK